MARIVVLVVLSYVPAVVPPSVAHAGERLHIPPMTIEEELHHRKYQEERNLSAVEKQNHRLWQVAGTGVGHSIKADNEPVRGIGLMFCRISQVKSAPADNDH